MTTPLLTVEEVKVMLPVRDSNTSFDARITKAIAVASSQIENAVNRSFTKAERTQQFRTPDTRRVGYDFTNTTNESGVYVSARRVRYVLQAMPVDTEQPFTVHYDPTGVFGADTLLPATSYRLDAAEGLLQVQHDMRDTMAGLQVVFTGGYAEASGTLSDAIPDDLRMAATAQAVHLFNRITPDNIGVDQDRAQGKNATAQFSVRGGLVPEAAALVARFKATAMGLY